MSNFTLEKNKVNKIVLTLSERAQLLDANFLIAFRNKFSMDEITTAVSVKNSAPQNNRYDLLIITEKTSPNNIDAEVHLIEGEWSYEVYESTLPTLLIDDTTGRVLQRGLAIVK